MSKYKKVAVNFFIVLAPSHKKFLYLAFSSFLSFLWLFFLLVMAASDKQLSYTINLLLCYRRVHYTQSHFCRRVFLYVVFTQEVVKHIHLIKIVPHNEFATLLQTRLFITLSCIFVEGFFFILCLHKRLSNSNIWQKNCYS